MSTKHFTANVISATKVVPDGNKTNSAASGVWDLSEHFDLVKGDNWPNVANLAATMQIFGGRLANGSGIDSIQRITIPTTGNAVDTGDLTSVQMFNDSGGGSTTRGIQAHGTNGSFQRNDIVDYTTFASTGNATDFGNLSNSRNNNNGFSNNVRFLSIGGATGDFDSNLNYMDYFTIASTGNATDFGDTNAKAAGSGAGASTTRGIYANGMSSVASGTATNVVEYVTIANTGNASDFGDLQKNNVGGGGASNSVKFLVLPSDGSNNFTVDQFTIASTGNGTDFGDMVTTRQYATAGASSLRVVFAGGENTSSVSSNVIQYFTIASAGNSTDFGNLNQAVKAAGSNANAHGGIPA